MTSQLDAISKSDVKDADSILNMDEVRVDPKWALRVPGNLAVRRQLLPFTIQDDRVLVACKNVEDAQGLQAVQRYVGHPVEAKLADAESLERAIELIFLNSALTSDNENAPARVNLSGQRGAAADPEGDEIVALGDEIFHAALIQNATDIHIEPTENKLRVRIRVDGALEDYRELPASIHAGLISRFKVLAGMDIAERRAPQDGRFTIGHQSSRPIDVRAATIPTKLGERMTLRLLAMNTRDLTLERLGMLPSDLKTFRQAIHRPHGLIALTGPTGCGKSTTLYAALRELIQDNSQNIITIEEPVEYVVEGISQVEVDSADKVSFHKALRSILRHDPDVIMIGEIRDEETAEIATQAALTGHLVFTTLHTNSARDSVTRLLDMGVQPFLLSAVARLFAAQRLVRKLCQRCRFPTPLSEEQASFLGHPEIAGVEVFESRGCEYCANSGYSGRTGLFELVGFQQSPQGGSKVSSLNQGTIDFEAQITPDSRYLIDDAIDKMKRGITNFDQVATVVHTG